jgi:hypothetical protein
MSYFYEKSVIFMRSVILFIILAIGFISLSFAQEVISSGGDYSQNSGLSISYTIGETVTESFEFGQQMLTQGFQQAKLDVASIESSNFRHGYRLYPNPTQDIIWIERIEQSSSLTNYSLMDIQGRVLNEFKSHEAHVSIDLSHYPVAVFLLRISNMENANTYKITKQK